MASPNSPELSAAIAAHRFGLGEASLAPIGTDATGWLLAQIGPATPQQGRSLASGAEATRVYARFLREQREARRAPVPMPPAMAEPAPGSMPATADGRSGEEVFVAHFRDLVSADVRARLVTATSSTRPFSERLALFWANHFTVSMAKASARGIVGAFEREAIRPHIGGRFETLLQAAATHPGMLRYLDNDQSAGPDSALVQRLARRAGRDGNTPRVSGLNENLAREILELHTLGVGAGYTQADVTEFARVLTGWRVALADAEPATRFDPAWHQPGPKRVLGKSYPEGPEALTLVLRDLAAHPATARFVCTKLARHWVADEPPPALVARLVETWRASDGDLAAVTRTLVLAPEAWLPQPAKLKTPEEFVITSARLLQLGDTAFQRPPDGGISVLGQRVQAAPSPAGWPDRAEDWLGPDAVWKRVEWATRVAARVGARIDARARAEASLGPLLSSTTRQQIERAADGPQALALLLLAPEFQRR